MPTQPNSHCARADYKNRFSLWGFPDFLSKNNKIKSRNTDQTLQYKYTHIKYCLKHIVYFACSYAKSLQFIGYCFKIPYLYQTGRRIKNIYTYNSHDQGTNEIFR